MCLYEYARIVALSTILRRPRITSWCCNQPLSCYQRTVQPIIELKSDSRRLPPPLRNSFSEAVLPNAVMPLFSPSSPLATVRFEGKKKSGYPAVEEKLSD